MMRSSAVLTCVALATLATMLPLPVVSTQALRTPTTTIANANDFDPTSKAADETSTTNKTNNNMNYNPADDIPMFNPANGIPLFVPGGETIKIDSATINPLARAGNAAACASRSPTGENDDATTNITTPTPTAPLGPQQNETNGIPTTLIPGTNTPVPGSQCTPTYTYGSIAVSVEGGGTFCAFPPVCSGMLLANCPGLQPGLGGPARCAIVEGGVYGCVP